MCEDLYIDLSLKLSLYLDFQHFSLILKRIFCPQIYLRYGT